MSINSKTKAAVDTLLTDATTTEAQFKTGLQDVTTELDLAQTKISGSVALGNDLLFGDNDKAIFGAGSDLQIYHDGQHSAIQEVGTGNLYIQSNGAQILLQPIAGEQGIIVNANADVGLYYNNSPKMATTSTGIDVTGTATMDGLTVGDGTSNATNTILFDTNSGGTTKIESVTDGLTNQSLHFYTTFSTEKERMSITEDGDISFYEDTGTTAKFFWDASAESLGIGTASPSTKLDLSDVSRYTFNLNNAYTLQTSLNAAGSAFADDYKNAAQHIWQTSGTERMRIDTSGKVGIGTTSPAVSLDITGTDGIVIPAGTTAQQPTGEAGMIRYNTTNNAYEGHDGTQWSNLGSGGGTGGGQNVVFFENDTNVTDDYTITSGKNAMTAGPITVDSGITVTVPTGSVWTIV